MSNYFLIPESEPAQAAMGHLLNGRHKVSNIVNVLKRHKCTDGSVTILTKAIQTKAIAALTVPGPFLQPCEPWSFTISNDSHGDPNIYLPPGPGTQEPYKITVFAPAPNKRCSKHPGFSLYIQASSRSFNVEVFDPLDASELRYQQTRKLSIGVHKLHAPHTLTIGAYKFRMGYPSMIAPLSSATRSETGVRKGAAGQDSWVIVDRMVTGFRDLAFDDDDCILVPKGVGSGKQVAFSEDGWILV